MSSDQLQDLIRRLALPGGLGAGPFPGPRPADPDKLELWLAEVATMRARHDAEALSSGTAYEQMLTETLGADPLGAQRAPVAVSWAELPDGAGLRIYRPEQTSNSHPAIVLIHGGAFWMGGGSAGWVLNDPLCRKLAGELSAVVVNVDHRLAPEHPFPAPLDDVRAAIRWSVENAASLRIDPDRVAVFGISSGGNLASSVAGPYADATLPTLAAVVLQCASVNLDMTSSRYESDPEDRAGVGRIVELYAGEASPTDPRVSPGLAPQLGGLPPHLIVTADYDPLTADALTYVTRLRQAGVAVEHHPYPMTHTVATPATFRAMHDDTVAWLSEQLKIKESLT